jgi:hypothetical protein
MHKVNQIEYLLKLYNRPKIDMFNSRMDMTGNQEFHLLHPEVTFTVPAMKFRNILYNPYF